MTVVELPGSECLDRITICPICNREVDLSEATIGANGDDGKPSIVHETHRRHRASWFAFWASFIFKCQERCRSRLDGLADFL